MGRLQLLVALGPGDPELIPLASFRALETAGPVRVEPDEPLAGWLGRQGLALADVKSWAIHPGGPKILAAVQDALGLPASALEASYAVLARHGNMSSPTLLFILDHQRRARTARPCVALGFGPGLAVEAALWR